MGRFSCSVVLLLAVAQYAQATGTSTYAEARVFTGTFESQGATSVSKTTESTSASSGAMQVSGGLGIAKQVHIAGARLQVGSVAEVTYTGGTAMFCHKDNTAVTTCGYRQLAAGSVELNAKTAQTTTFKINDVAKWTMDASGQVGIGTTSPGMKLDVNGGVQGTAAYSSTSDRRYKKDIVPLKKSLETVKNLTGVSFNWRHEEFPKKNFADGPQVGFIAQQIEKYVPEVVVTGKDGYKAVQYSQLTAHLVEAVKELAQENDELRKENEELAHDYDTLAQRMLRVEKLLAEMQ